MYKLSSTDRIFICITTHQCRQTHEILHVGIETRLTLRQSGILPLIHQQPHRKYRNVTGKYCFSFDYILRLTATGVLNSFEELCIKRGATGNSTRESSTLVRVWGEHMYCYPATDCFVVINITVEHISILNKSATIVLFRIVHSALM